MARKQVKEGEENKEKKGKFVGNCKECPEWMFVNEHIEEGYRVGYGYKDLFFSIFQLHNETANIWTHLLGAVLFVYLFFMAYFYIYIPRMKFEAFLDKLNSDQESPLFFLDFFKGARGYYAFSNLIATFRSTEVQAGYKAYEVFQKHLNFASKDVSPQWLSSFLSTVKSQ